MLDFRYHVVATVAVLLALVAGVVIGSAALNGSKVHDLSRHVDKLGAANRGLTSQIHGLENRIESDAAFASAAEPQIVSGKLAGVRVVVVSAPHAPSAVAAGLLQDLHAAGAVVASQVQLTDSYIDPSQVALLGDLADRLTPVDVAPATGTPDQRAGALLADALVGNVSGTDFTTIVQGFAAAGVLTVDGTPARGSIALFVSGPTRPVPTPLLSLIDQLATQRQLVVAGAGLPGSDAALFAARAEHTANVSTVDDADTAIGRIAVVLSLAAAQHGAPAGAFGTGPGATAPLPAITH